MDSYKAFLFKSDYRINFFAIIINTFAAVLTLLILLNSDPPKRSDIPLSGITGQLIIALLTQFFLGFIQVISNVAHLVYFRNDRRFVPWRLVILLVSFFYLVMGYLPGSDEMRADNSQVILTLFAIPQVIAYSYFLVVYRDYHSKAA